MGLPSFLSFGLHSSRQSAGRRPPVARVSNDSRENFCISIPGARQQCTPLSHTHTLTRSLSSSLMQERTHHKNDEGRRTDSGVPSWVLNRMRARACARVCTRQILENAAFTLVKHTPTRMGNSILIKVAHGLPFKLGSNSFLILQQKTFQP